MNDLINGSEKTFIHGYVYQFEFFNLSNLFKRLMYIQSIQSIMYNIFKNTVPSSDSLRI